MRKTAKLLAVLAMIATFGYALVSCGGPDGTTTTTANGGGGGDDDPVMSISAGGSSVSDGETVSIGTTVVGTSITAYAYISNTGGGSLEIGASSVAGSGYSESLPPTPTSIDAGSGATWGIEFDGGTMASTYQATVGISNISAGTYFEFTVEAVVTNPVFTGPMPLDFTDFKGWYRGVDVGGTVYQSATLTTDPMDSSFHGAQTIAQLKADIADDGAIASNYNITAQIHALAGYKNYSQPATNGLWIQDVTGAIYIIGRYSGAGDFPFDPVNDVGRIVDLIVTNAEAYHEAPQIVGWDAVTVRDASGNEPTDIQVFDMVTPGPALFGRVVRFAAEVIETNTDANPTVLSNEFFSDLAVHMGSDGVNDLSGFTNHSVVTAIGPLARYDSTFQLSIYYSPSLNTSDYFTNATQ